MRVTRLMAIVLCLVFSAYSEAKVNKVKTERDYVFKFLAKNVINRTLHAELEGRVEKEPYHFKCSRLLRFTRLEKNRTSNSLTFDAVFELNITYTKLDKKGRKTDETFKERRMVLMIYEMVEKRSTGKLVGYARVAKSSTGDDIGIAFTLYAELLKDGKTLELYESTVMYDDHSFDGRSFKPIRNELAMVFTTKKGKLEMEQTVTRFSVNPIDFKKTRVPFENGDSFTFVNTETDADFTLQPVTQESKPKKRAR